MENLTKKELYEKAKELKIKGRSKMSKKQLIEAIKSLEEKNVEEAYKIEEELIKEENNNEIKKDILIAESLIEDNFSSKTHVLKEDSTESPMIENRYIKEDYPIPERYNINKIVLLPVDPSKHFIYWEIKDDVLKELKNKYSKIKLVIKVYENRNEALTIDITSPIGKYYIHYHAPMEKLYAVLGVVADGQFIPLVSSKEIFVPSDEISEFSEEEIWMTKIKEWKEIIAKSYKKEVSYINSQQPFRKIIETLIENHIRQAVSSKENLK
jgi:hypothetical protein